jgi:2-dehydro-3-deoxy-D-arabinonate dehydratase
MKLGKIILDGRPTVAVFEGGQARPIPGYTFIELVERAELERISLTQLAGDYASGHAYDEAPILPLAPAEVWAVGCSYEASAAFRDAEHGTREGFYAHAHTAPRPEIFFKGTARHCVGPNGDIGIRRDSRFTAPEPELAVVLGCKGAIIGYTLANDVSAWDIERENPLYLPQSKIYTGCCAIGPVVVTSDELTNPCNLDISCTIHRGGAVIFDGSVNTRKLGRTIESLLEYLLLANPVPAGSVLLTGTGIIVPEECALKPGDVVTISSPEIGELKNTAVRVG